MNTYDGNNYTRENPYQQGNPYQSGNPYQQGGHWQSGAYNNFNNQFGGYGGNQIPRKAPNIFKQFLYSFVPSKYGNFANVGAGSMIGFVTLLTFTATLILFIIVMFRLWILGGMESFFNKVPDFEISNSRFSIEEEFYEAKGTSVFWATDEVEKFTYYDVMSFRKDGYTDIYLISRDNMVVFQNAKYREINFSDLTLPTVFNKSWIMNSLMPIVWIWLLIGMILFFICRTFWYFACATGYLLVGLIIAAVLKKNVSSGNLFKTAIYAKVVMFVAALVFSQIPLLPVLIPGILKMAVRFIVTVVFIRAAIGYMPQNR